MPGCDTEGVFISFSLVHRVDMSCLFIRLSTEKCCTNVAVTLSSLGWQEDKETHVSMLVFSLDFFVAFECPLRVRLPFQGLGNPTPANDLFFFFIS